MSDHPVALRPAGGRDPSPGPQSRVPYGEQPGQNLPTAYSSQAGSSSSSLNPTTRFPSGAYPQENYQQQQQQPPQLQPSMPEPYSNQPTSRSSSAGPHGLIMNTSQPPPMPGAIPGSIPQSPVQVPRKTASSNPFTSPPGTSSTSRPSSSHTNAGHRHAPMQHNQAGFTPTIRGHSRTPMHLLLINPNSTPSMTTTCLNSIRQTLPSHIEVTGYTAPQPAPTAIESHTDAVLSTEACLRDLAKYSAANHETVRNYDGMLVACFSKHPLIDALRETYDVPVIGIMEASMYVARMLGGRFGIVSTIMRSKIMQDDAIAAYGLSHFYVGSEPTNLGVLELESKPREEVLKRVSLASKTLAAKGADVILLGCAGMTDMVRAAKDAVREDDGRRMINVVDGVEAGVMILSGLVGMGVPTSKKGIYASAELGRRNRGQTWF